MIKLGDWEQRFETFLRERDHLLDAAHELEHVRRVVANARRLAAAEGARAEIVMPAAWLHDCVAVPKGSPRRHQASRLAADEAGRFLRAAGYPAEWISEIEHAIEAHSFAAGIEPRTLEARVVQDADRLDALGAVGLARCMMLGGAAGRAFYDHRDPFARHRAPDDTAYVIDHFFVKLLHLEERMSTATGRREATDRVEYLRRFLERLESEIKP